MSIARTLNKPVWVAAFSKTAWIVGPDSKGLFSEWSRYFEFKDGLIVSSKVFNGVKEQWPCLFSVWKFTPGKKREPQKGLELNVYDEDYVLLGRKELKPFSDDWVRLSELAKLGKEALGKRSDFITVPPLENEHEIAKKIYDDTLPKEAIGYFRFVANDVYNSAQRVQYLSSMYGPSNHNGVPILRSNFDKCLSVYGIRKAVRRTWLNDKDEFYFPNRPGASHRSLLRKAAIFALVDGGYASSLAGIKYKDKKFDLRNEFCIAAALELRNWGANDVPGKSSHAVEWLSTVKSQLTKLEADAVQAAKDLIRVSFKNNLRAKGDPNRHLSRGDAGIRQLINGIFAFEKIELGDKDQETYDRFIAAKEKLRCEIEKEVYRLGILMPFSDAGDDTDASPGELAVEKSGHA